jgi:hypothetical protein
VQAGDHKDSKEYKSRSHSSERSNRHHRDRYVGDRQQHRRDLAERQHYQEKKYRRDNHYSHNRDHHRHHYPKKKYYKDKRRHHSDYFLGGLVLGSLGAHYLHDDYRRDYRHDYRYDHRYDNRSRGHRAHFWRDRFGDCYRVEYRKRGKVYVQVPRRKCY